MVSPSQNPSEMWRKSALFVQGYTKESDLESLKIVHSHPWPFHPMAPIRTDRLRRSGLSVGESAILVSVTHLSY